MILELLVLDRANMKLVVVESPAKCSKIQGFLGEGYRVVATMGHIRALEENLDSVGIDRNWEPKYMEITTKKDAISKLKKAAKGAEVILATDDDREGEGIAWHVCCILNLNPLTTPRIVFHEITKPAILQAVGNPKLLDIHKVNAQQSRAMLDLLVGFTISKVLWNHVAPKLSAGRCQTPALRLVAERDKEVEDHKAASFWRLSGVFQHKSLTIHGQASQDITDEKEANAVLQKVHGNTRTTVLSVKESVSTNQAPKPLITSTLQQEASNLHGLNPKVTMQLAQKLYEAGHITYMRTDNPLLSEEASQMIRSYVLDTYGEEYIGPIGQHTSVAGTEAKSKKKTKGKEKTNELPAAQAAHEAIRPTHPETEPEIEDAMQKKIYMLIWRRATQSQMAASLTNVRKANVAIDADIDRIWLLEQSKSQFLGFRILEQNDSAKHAEDVANWDNWSAILQPTVRLDWVKLCADEMFTKPKGRFTEASLIAELEKRGIGRPSTFATLVTTILDRDYVEKTNVEGKNQDSKHLVLSPHTWPPQQKVETHKVGAEKNKIRATSLGKSVIVYLSTEYADLFDYTFTASMEQNLDEIAKANKPWKSLLQETWDTYKDRYTEHTSGPRNRSSKERVLSSSVKVIVSRRGILFVKETLLPKKTTAFAPLLPHMSFETATLSDSDEAFIQAEKTKQGEVIGIFETEEIRKKKGPYGLYVECKGVRIPLKPGDEDNIEKVKEKIAKKIEFQATETAYSRVVGDFTIKKGAYGLYFYKHTLKRATFVTLPKTIDPASVTVEDIQALYSTGLQKKREMNKIRKDKKA